MNHPLPTTTQQKSKARTTKPANNQPVDQLPHHIQAEITQQQVDEPDHFSSRLTSKERRRRFWHMLPGFLPLILWAIPHADPLSPILRTVLIAVSAIIGISIFAKYRKIARSEDNGRTMSVLGYAGSVLLTLMLFPADIELGFTVLAILAFGDGTATLAGRLLRGPCLPWNRQKTWAGFCGFLLVGIPAATIIFWGETQNLEAQTPGVSLQIAAIYAIIATTLAAIAESVPSRINDNFRVGITAAITLATLHFFVIA